MEMTRQDRARENLRKAIKAAGGTVDVAQRAGIPQTHLSSIASGKRGMGKEAAGKLRPHIDLALEDWVDLLAPVDDVEPEAVQA